MELTKAYNLENCELHRNSAVVRDGITIDQWKSDFNKLIITTECCLWWIGDFLNYGRRQYGEAYADALKVSDMTGYNVDTVRWAMIVSERVPLVNRFTTLSWSHHREVRLLPERDQSKWLTKALESRWTRLQLRQAIKDANKSDDDAQEPDDASIEFAGCEEINKVKRFLTGLQKSRPISEWGSDERDWYIEQIEPIVEFYNELKQQRL